MSDDLKLKKLERDLLEQLVGMELIHLAKEIGLATSKSVRTGTLNLPDFDARARKIIAIVKEHSV